MERACIDCLLFSEALRLPRGPSETNDVGRRAVPSRCGVPSLAPRHLQILGSRLSLLP